MVNFALTSQGYKLIRIQRNYENKVFIPLNLKKKIRCNDAIVNYCNFQLQINVHIHFYHC